VEKLADLHPGYYHNFLKGGLDYYRPTTFAAENNEGVSPVRIK
jgi:hypothetical protein